MDRSVNTDIAVQHNGPLVDQHRHVKHEMMFRLHAGLPVHAREELQMASRGGQQVLLAGRSDAIMFAGLQDLHHVAHSNEGLDLCSTFACCVNATRASHEVLNKITQDWQDLQHLSSVSTKVLVWLLVFSSKS